MPKGLATVRSGHWRLRGFGVCEGLASARGWRLRGVGNRHRRMAGNKFLYPMRERASPFGEQRLSSCVVNSPPICGRLSFELSTSVSRAWHRLLVDRRIDEFFVAFRYSRLG